MGVTNIRGIDKLLFRIPEAATALGVGRSKLYELIAQHELEVVHIGRSIRVPRDALETFVERRRNEERLSAMSRTRSTLGADEGSSR